MSAKFLYLSVFILLFCGCSTITEENKNKSAEVSIPTSTFSARKNSFSPTFKSTEEDKYYDAVEIYDSSPKASQGLYRYEGLVFVVICIDTKKENIEYLEGTAMLRTAAILRKHYPELPPRFRIRHRVVDKNHDYDTGMYRYATVYREKDIKEKLKK